ncbi:MAG: hypothetical protein K0Q90_4263 [Paenibacillaceae bacterium]|nr:hypothetical protein [Paenibacillaceae bacterium]
MSYAPDSTRQFPGQETSAMIPVIRSWLDALSGEPGFEGWNAATWTVYPLGPGTHSWVVLLQADSREIGYLVLTADGEDYRLQEYGQGPYPLFSMNTLHRTLAQRGLISESIPSSYTITRIYAAPLQGVWRVDGAADEPLYLDAKTGDELPSLDAWILEQQAAEPAPSSPALSHTLQPGALTGASVREPFDPFLKPVWLKGSPQPQLDFASWKSGPMAAEAPVTYLGKWFGGKALYPLAATGYQEWSHTVPFIRLEHEGARYVPYADAVKLGSFYLP